MKWNWKSWSTAAETVEPLTTMNPWNGIESHRHIEIRIILAVPLSRNPWNGIERSYPGRAINLYHSSHRGIHEMELKDGYGAGGDARCCCHPESMKWNWKQTFTIHPLTTWGAMWIHEMELKDNKTLKDSLNNFFRIQNPWNGIERPLCARL